MTPSPAETRSQRLELAMRIRAGRRSCDMSQLTAAERLGVAPRTYSRWEAGECEPGALALAAMADLFKATADELLGRPPVYQNWPVLVTPSRLEMQLRRDAEEAGAADEGGAGQG
jgi:transcriptional regulator with XRE-family HTH domain